MSLMPRLDRVLMHVEKPARYTGGEWNSVVKDWNTVETKIALAFPEIYDLGMSNLGLAILYDIVNRQPGMLAERVYAPWVDMEAAMRGAGIPLYGLESKRPLADFDILGFSLPYEQLYTNVVNMLDLAGLPVLAEERDAHHPLVIAGGSGGYNPEPMSPFIDAFVIGEGEEAILDVVRCYQHWRRDTEPWLQSPGLAEPPTLRAEPQGEASNLQPPASMREDLLHRLARIPGVYVPRFYRSEYNDDGTLRRTAPVTAEAAYPVVKRVVPMLPPPVTRFVVPYIDVVHNRAVIEIQRGCSRGCRFCQAGMIYRPVRERPPEEILQAVDDIVAHTGLEEVALLSLSTSDYSHIGELVKAIAASLAGRHVCIGLPSLRIESFAVDLAEKTDGRRTGFTFAPEAATERLRQVINKVIPDRHLLQVADEVYRRGWRAIKLYFMIGQPTETEADVQAIVELAKQVHAVGRRHHGNAAGVRVGVSTFVPKPHTPFQWTALADLDTIRARQQLLQRGLRGKGLILNWNEPEESLLEAVLARGDRRVGRAIHRAWQKGARFDGWSDRFNRDAWWSAFAEESLDPHFYAGRPRPADEVFPWDHIDVGVQKHWLWMDYQASLEGETRRDCRERCFACGILSTFRELRAQTPAEAWQCPPVQNVKRET
jgi:radical SAM family uncharacterized protein